MNFLSATIGVQDCQLRGVLSIRLHNGPPPKTKIFEISLGPVQDIPEDPPDAFLRVLGQTVGELEPENPNRAVFGSFLATFQTAPISKWLELEPSSLDH